MRSNLARILPPEEVVEQLPPIARFNVAEHQRDCAAILTGAAAGLATVLAILALQNWPAIAAWAAL
ncbi:MAG TPA: hypothetical protein VGD10_08230 [Allosphingosinicella sp.]|uniref:hypothetical protein n=1 Tax=Allosphingosinicella sp. TaxID=2823234 RepID=UPI002EDAC275